jgi:hypothetical protein
MIKKKKVLKRRCQPDGHCDIVVHVRHDRSDRHQQDVGHQGQPGANVINLFTAVSNDFS